MAPIINCLMDKLVDLCVTLTLHTSLEEDNKAKRDDVKSMIKTKFSNQLADFLDPQNISNILFIAEGKDNHLPFITVDINQLSPKENGDFLIERTILILKSNEMLDEDSELDSQLSIFYFPKNIDSQASFKSND